MWIPEIWQGFSAETQQDQVDEPTQLSSDAEAAPTSPTRRNVAGGCAGAQSSIDGFYTNGAFEILSSGGALAGDSLQNLTIPEPTSTWCKTVLLIDSNPPILTLRNTSMYGPQMY